MNPIFLTVAIVVPLMIFLFLVREKLPSSFFRKIIHSLVGFLFVNVFFKLVPKCSRWYALYPAIVMIMYVLALFLPKLSFIPMFLSRDQRYFPFGILEWCACHLIYPLTDCDRRVGAALLCMSGGDGFAGFASAIVNKTPLPFNKQKSFIGCIFGLCGALLFLKFYGFEGYKSLELSIVTVCIECLPLTEHDNIVVFGAALSFQFFRKETVVFICFAHVMNVFY